MLKKLGCYIINLCLTDLWKRGGVIIGTECADREFLRVNVFLYCNIFSAISFSTLSLVQICDWCENNHTSSTPISGKKFFKNKSTRIVTVCQVYSVFEELSLIALYTLKNGFFLKTYTAQKKIRRKYWSGDEYLNFPVSPNCKGDVIVSPLDDVNGSFYLKLTF